MKLTSLSRIALCLILLGVPSAAHAQRATNAAVSGYASITLDPGYEGEEYSASVEQVLRDKYRLKLKGVSQAAVFDWVAVDPMPLGLTIDPASGQIFGTLLRARPQPYLFRLHVFDKTVANPSPLRLQINLNVGRGPRPGPAPTLVAIDPPAEHHGANGSNGNGEGNGDSVGNGDSQAAQSPTPTPAAQDGDKTGQKQPESAAKPEKPGGRRGGKQTDRGKNNPPKAEEPSGEGEGGGEGSDDQNGDDKKKIQVVPPKAVARGATSTPITIIVKDETVQRVTITVEEEKKDKSKKALKNYFPDPIAVKKDGNYTVVIPLAEEEGSATLVTVGAQDDKGTVVETSGPLTITRDALSGQPRVEVAYSRLVNREATTIPLEITANDPKLVKLLYVVSPNKELTKVSDYDLVTLPRGEGGALKLIGIPSDDKITVRLFDVTNLPTETSDDIDKAKTQAVNDESPLKESLLQTLYIERRSGGGPVSTIVTNSLNTRAIIGFEQAGASSADSKSQPFLDFFFTAPMRFKPKGDSLPRVSAWGQVRLAAVPQQVSTFGALPANFVGPVVENKLTSLVQGFDFMAGLEVRVFGTDKPYMSLIPGVKNQTFLHIIGGGGAISPLSRSANRDAAEIFTIPVEGNPQLELFKQRFPEAVERKAKYIAFVFPDRDRFLRQFYGGIRLKTFYYNDDGTLINRFPAIFDFTVGQNEAVTGGRLQSDVTDENGKLIGRERRYVLRVEAFYPLPIKEASFLYLYGTAMMKIGGGGVKIDTPLFLDQPGSADKVTLTNNDIFITPTLQTNRDYYRFGVGVNLTELFNRTPPRERDR
ncbi:MAG TPA: hypothetical protein VJ842_17195 [Pyrinomonadaceae bacterium]|nr:hypothetical protein [Pyrinomonadaceae bacterium]